MSAEPPFLLVAMAAPPRSHLRRLALTAVGRRGDSAVVKSGFTVLLSEAACLFPEIRHLQETLRQGRAGAGRHPPSHRERAAREPRHQAALGLGSRLESALRRGSAGNPHQPGCSPELSALELLAVDRGIEPQRPP